MNLRTFLANMPRGGPTQFADRLGISPVYLSQIAARQKTSKGDEREASPELCVVIERESNYMVLRWDLRPNDWHLIWPELIGAKGAPAPPETQQREAA
jgi:DNA-binding transcriptional regulator YdaS (Cro superfamily)